MTFPQFSNAVDDRLRPHGVTLIPEQDRKPEQAGWLSPSGDMYAFLFHHPEGAQPVRLAFSTVGNQSTEAMLPPYPLMLDDQDARTAALMILRQFSERRSLIR